MKREKCDFFKKHLQYLGHLILEEGFEPLPEKIKSIKNMPPLKTAKKVKQFLGLAGYYWKFVPRFADLSRPLTNLTRQNVEFEWTEKCQKSFDNLGELLIKYPILQYPDPNKYYTLFTDASKFRYAGILTQEYEEDGVTKYHPVCYVSRLFRGSQLNWAALTKEAYAIYMAVRKLTFYITGHNIKVKRQAGGNRFCITVIDMLTGYTMAAPIPNKSAETIVKTYMNHVYSIFRSSSRMLTDNGSEFKHDVFDEVCAKLGIKRVYSPVYTPQSNGKLEGFHHSFKACISKHIHRNQLEWDEIVPLTTAAYNFFPCQSSRESPFVLMFGRDPITPFLSLLEPYP